MNMKLDRLHTDCSSHGRASGWLKSFFFPLGWKMGQGGVNTVNFRVSACCNAREVACAPRRASSAVISRRDVGWNPRRSFVKTVAFTKLMHASRPAPDLDGKSGKFSTPAAPLISPPRSESPAGIFFKWIYFYRFAPADTVSSFIFCKKEGGVSVSSRVLKEDQESRNGRVSYVCERVNRFNERELEWKWRRGTR